MSKSPTVPEAYEAAKREAMEAIAKLKSGKNDPHGELVSEEPDWSKG